MVLSTVCVEGWILDAYPVSGGMCVWVVDSFGRAFSCLDPWFPSFYLETTPVFIDPIQKLLQSFRTPISLERVERREFFTKKSVPVIQIGVRNPLVYPRVVQRLLRFSMAEPAGPPSLSLYNADINLSQAFFYERGLFPLAHCFIHLDKKGMVRAWSLADSPWEMDYALPPLRYAHLGLETSIADPNHAGGGTRGRGCAGGYTLTLGREPGVGTSYVFNDSEEDLIQSLNRHMQEWDPDILLTDWGDSYIMPRLQWHADRSGISLKLSRDPRKAVAADPDHQFFSYGKFVYRAGLRTLFGRLHIDVKNSFNVAHTGLEGLFEIARVARIPLQRAARCTIGTALSSIQHEWAIRNQYLIPLDKGQTEDFRPADELIASDRGGLVYEPEIGWHEDLIEFDFVSMYPEIMIRHNVTPEAMNCVCCPDNRVPGIHHHICRRRGMIPDVLYPIVEKRRKYKEMILAGHPRQEVFKRWREAFKWALVTCFGYLGFRNARFGKIEAHECVGAYSREALLKAKETAEEAGFHFLHAIVDSLWLKKEGTTPEEIEALRLKIEERTGLPLGYEGRYRWIRFCPSKMNARVGVPNRYFGAFTTGEVKIRGIEARRHDTPPFIKSLQERVLTMMAGAKNLRELRRLHPRLQGCIDATLDSLRSGHMSPVDLAITFRLSQAPSEYVHDTLSALAAKKLAASGVPLHPGEMVQYVVSEERDRIKDWRVTPLALIEGYFEYDVKYYERLVKRAVDFVDEFHISSRPVKQYGMSHPPQQLNFPF